MLTLILPSVHLCFAKQIRRHTILKTQYFIEIVLQDGRKFQYKCGIFSQSVIITLNPNRILLFKTASYTYVELCVSWRFCLRSRPSGKSSRPERACPRTGPTGPTGTSRGRPRVRPLAIRTPWPARCRPRSAWRGRRAPADTSPRRQTAGRPCPAARGRRGATPDGRHRWTWWPRWPRRSTARRPPSGRPWIPRFWSWWSWWSRGPARVAVGSAGGRQYYTGGCVGVRIGLADGRAGSAAAVARGHVTCRLPSDIVVRRTRRRRELCAQVV